MRLLTVMSSQRRTFCIYLVLSLSTVIVCSDSIDYACKDHDVNSVSYGFCNTSLPIKERVEDLIRRMSLEEKVGQLSNGASDVRRLGIPRYEWWSESLHGIAINGPGVNFDGPIPAATIFPQVILSAASFNTTLWFRTAQAIAVEARAMYNVGQAGLTFWAPNINIFRDPRWGRGQETPGEDPFLTSEFAVAFVRGFQGENESHNTMEKSQRSTARRELKMEGVNSLQMEPSRLMLSACCKHFTAYDLDSWQGYARYTFNAVVSEQDLKDTFEPPFQRCVQDGHASCMMCSYNQLNGVPVCANYDLLTQMTRHDWGLEGYITSDCDAVAIIYEDQHYATCAEDAVTYVLKAGMDIDCGTYLLRNTMSAIKKGKLHESVIDQALFNLFSIQMRLGLFDGDPKQQEYGHLGLDHVCTNEHWQLALDGSRQGIVLLKNIGNTLPLLKNQINSVAVIGPNANATEEMLGDYIGISCNPVTPFLALQNYIGNISFSKGCENVACSSNAKFGEAIDIVAKADAVVIVVGLDLTQEREDHDRVNLTLPGQQQRLVSEVAAASKGPVVLVLMCGGPVDVSFAKDDPRISSILWVGYPGEAGGQALAEIIFGDYNPGGRLPMTWYPQEFINVPMTDMNMRPNSSTGYPGRTYRFYTGETVFQFGEGLSYSNYSYKFVSTDGHIILPFSLPSYGEWASDYIDIDNIPCDSLTFTTKLTVQNHGSMDGSHVVLLFSRYGGSSRGAPRKKLISFKRVHVVAGKATDVSFLVSPCKHFDMVMEDGRRVLAAGNHELMVGDTKLSVSLTTNFLSRD